MINICQRIPKLACLVSVLCLCEVWIELLACAELGRMFLKDSLGAVNVLECLSTGAQLLAHVGGVVGELKLGLRLVPVAQPLTCSWA